MQVCIFWNLSVYVIAYVVLSGLALAVCDSSAAERIHSFAHCCQEEPDGHCQHAGGARCSDQRRIQGELASALVSVLQQIDIT